MFSCASINTQYSYTVLYLHVLLYLTSFIVVLQWTLPPCSAVLHCIYRIATLHSTAMFSCASINIQYSYTVLYLHVLLCLTSFTVVLHWTLPPCSAVSHYIHSIATLHFKIMFGCASQHILYSYTVLDRHVQVWHTTYTVYLHCILPHVHLYLNTYTVELTELYQLVQLYLTT